ncbi:hypothetical protein U1Q18_019434 [Sarracenia purpurea var. burkii]
MGVDESLIFRKTDLGLILKMGLFCSYFVLVTPSLVVAPILSIDWVLIVVLVERRRPPRWSPPGTVDHVVVTSDADDGGAGVRALKAFFEMKGFTKVAEAACISLAVLAGTTRVGTIADDGGFVGSRWMVAMVDGVP